MAFVLAVSACVYPDPDPGPLYHARAIETALQVGNLELARSARTLARQRHSYNGTVLWWSATVSQMLGQNQTARAELQGLLHTADRAGISEAEIKGQIGGLLFRMGNYGESIPYLEAGSVGPEAERRRAFGKLARELPYVRTQIGALATELPLFEDSLLELICSIGDIQRAFALDSGTSMTTLSQTLAKELRVSGIRPVGMTTHDNGEAYSVSIGVLRRFAVGDVQLGSIPVLVVEDQRLTLRDMFGGADQTRGGVVGMDLLAIFRMTIDLDRQSVVMEVPRGLPEADSVRCLWLRGRWIVPVTIEGRQLWFILDTGASHSSLTPRGLEALANGPARATPTFRRVRSAGGTMISVRELTGLVLRAAGIRFSGVQLPVIPRGPSQIFPIHGVLGADLLLLCRMTLDSGRLRLEARSGR